MITILAYAFATLVGFGIAFLISLLVRIWLPSLAIPTFVILSSCDRNAGKPYRPRVGSLPCGAYKG